LGRLRLFMRRPAYSRSGSNPGVAVAASRYRCSGWTADLSPQTGVSSRIGKMISLGCTVGGRVPGRMDVEELCPSEFRRIDRVAFLLATSLLWVVPSLAADHLTADQVRAAAAAAPTGKLDLSGKIMSGDNLTGLDLSGAKLAGADLTGVNLHGVKLVGADLTRADLSGADLTFAWIMRANFADARLHGATMGTVH
jgi:Pentapeptide repeats (8 copies)